MAENTEYKIGTHFVVGDVMSMFDCTEDEAEEFLERNGKYITDAMTERGWEAIKDLGLQDGLKRCKDG